MSTWLSGQVEFVVCGNWVELAVLRLFIGLKLSLGPCWCLEGRLAMGRVGKSEVEFFREPKLM
jgi:hypothetical protein